MFNVIGIYTRYFVGVPSEHVHVVYKEVYKFGSVDWTEFLADFKMLLRVGRESYRF